MGQSDMIYHNICLSFSPDNLNKSLCIKKISEWKKYILVKENDHANPKHYEEVLPDL